MVPSTLALVVMEYVSRPFGSVKHQHQYHSSKSSFCKQVWNSTLDRVLVMVQT